MANRLTKIYTRTGDKGSTGMADGSRIDKDDVLVSTIGDIDELNSQLAVVAYYLPDTLRQSVITIQNELFNIGAELTLGEAIITAENVSWLENKLDDMNQSLQPLKEFILPGGGLAASHCHVARAICRRAERTLVSLSKTRSINENLKAYINRLSDYLFVLARTVSKEIGEEEVYWQSDRTKN